MNSILTPVLALVVWSLLVWIWMYATRIPAMQAGKVDPQSAAHPGSLNVLPSRVRAVADNYNHLMEQPTIFYAVALVIALTGTGDGINAWIAWGYVGLRIVHSLWHSTVNQINIRFLIFAASSLCLMALTLHAAIAVFQAHG